MFTFAFDILHYKSTTRSVHNSKHAKCHFYIEILNTVLWNDERFPVVFHFKKKMVNLSVVQIGCNTIMFNHVRERLCMSNVKTLDLKKSMIKNKQNIKAVENHFMCENLINLNIIIIINDKL